ncbi:hypothetical protein [Corynebacterium durum]|uniref:Uncharacterized protein n=1 Tax=Corynebacterium durum F0235 TaxID=1035195 RepID=L1MEE7_9CORY|nr:hypothetical protein [Corynebacterium durum]EKX89425.1 hypothetical protein HMPREF9997_01896 [Corynebacterium durum F0235]
MIPIIITILGATSPQILNYIGENFQKRRKILQNIELLNKLPNNSNQVENLTKWIDAQIEEYIHIEKDSERNWFEFSIGLIVLLAGIYMAWHIYQHESWWQTAYLISILLISLGATGVSQGLKKTKREERGNIVRAKHEDRHK